METCSVKDCNNKHFAKGLCKEHYYKQYNKQWREDNKEHDTSRKKKWHAEHKEEQIKYRKDNKEHRAEINKKWREERKEERAKYHKQWLQTPRGKVVTKISRIRRKELKSDLTVETVQQTYEENISKHNRLICELCGKPIKFGEDSLEHFHPISRADTYRGKSVNERSNLGVAHKVCNDRKGTMTKDEWFAKHPELLTKQEIQKC